MKNLIESYRRIMSTAHSKHLAALSQDCKISCFQPTVLQQSRVSKTPYIVAESAIPAFNGIFMISTEESITSKQFVGASNYDTFKIRQSFDKAISMYEVMAGEELQGVFKMLIQIYANQAETTGKQMPLRTFSSNILQQKSHALNLYQYAQSTLSPYLRNILIANNQLLKKLQAIINQHFIRLESEEQFISIFNYCRKVSRRLSQHSAPSANTNCSQNYVDFIAPVIPQMKQSLSPNCRVLGKYFSHLRSSVYYVESVREINVGEELSLGYREGLNNYDMLIRYNQLPFDESTGQLKCIENPNSEYVLFMDSIQTPPPIFASDADRKVEVLREHGLKMKSVIKIGRKGKVNAQDMMMLRILYTTEPYSPSRDSQIYELIGQAVAQHLAINLDLTKVKKPVSTSTADVVIESIRVIEREQKQILKEFLMAHQ